MTLMALLVVALPLCAVLVAVVLSVERQADTEQRAILEAMAATRATRNLVLQLELVQRQAQNYLVDGSPDLLEFYLKARSDLVDSVDRLRGMLENGAELQLLARFAQAESGVHSRMSRRSPGSAVPEDDREQAELRQLGRDLLGRMELMLSDRLGHIEEAANEAGRGMLWPALVVVPLTGVLALASTLMIVRPIRRMENAVKGLGEGRFDTPIAIDGPGDIARLGEQLDWLRRRLDELEHEKARFLGHISHELKTPLAAIRESSELLTDGALGDLSGNQREVADIMRENSVKLQGLIEGLLNFNVRKVRNPDGRQLLSLDQVTAQVLASHGPMLRKKRIRLRENLSPVRLKADEKEIAVAIDNLISNAVKYSPIDGALEVALVADRRRVVLDVRDEGPGIDSRDRKRVFEAFFQGRPPAGEFVPGTGLGLSIAAEHISAHGGELSIVDTHRSGAHLRVVLPTAADDQPTGSRESDVGLEEPPRWRERGEIS